MLERFLGAFKTADKVSTGQAVDEEKVSRIVAMLSGHQAEKAKAAPEEKGVLLAKAAASSTTLAGIDKDTFEQRSTVLKDAKRPLLGIEKEAADEIDRRLEDLTDLYVNSFYPSIDLSFLGWRRKSDGYPVFACFLPSDPRCCIEVHPGMEFGFVRHSAKFKFFPDIKDITKHYSAYCEETASRLRNEYMTQMLWARFAGIIPGETRAKIKNAQNQEVFEHVIIIAEAAWQVKMEPADPLVVGLRKGKGWLIDKFDLSPIEKIVGAEFSTENKS